MGSVIEQLLSCQECDTAKKINQTKMISELIPHNVPVKRKPVPLKIKCPVCERPAPDHLHFGGQSCYPCRGFFRRISKLPPSSIECKSGKDDCFRTYIGKKCVKCRYEKCLKAGMKSSILKNSETLQLNKLPVQSGSTIESKIYKESDVTEEHVSDSMINKQKFQGRSLKRKVLESEKVSVIFKSSSSETSQDSFNDNDCLDFSYKKLKSDHKIHIQGS